MTLAPDIGCQTPRIEVVPEFETTSGEEACELAELSGLYLDPWQRYILRRAMGERVLPPVVVPGIERPADAANWATRWTAFEVGLIVARQNGKGSAIEARQLAGLFILGEKLQLYSSHEFKTSIEMFARIRALITNTDSLRKLVRRITSSHGDEGIELMDGRRLRFIARSTGSGRGFTADTTYLDEAFNLPGAAMAAIMPTMAAVPNPQIWYASSAGWEISRVLGNLRRRAQRLVANPDPASRLLYLEWSADDEVWMDARTDQREFCLNPENWRLANPGYGIRITPEFIQAEFASMQEDLALFARERLSIGQWPEDESGWNVIPENAWRSRMNPDASPSGRLTLAVDVTPDRSRGVIAFAGSATGPGTRAGERVVEISDRRSGVEWIPGRLSMLITRHKPSLVVISPRGPAGPLLPDIRTATEVARRRYRTEIRETTSQEEAHACQAFYDGVMSKRDVVQRGDLALDSALAGARRKENMEAGTWHWSRRTTSTDLSPLWAASLALWGQSVAPAPRKSWAELA